MMLRHQPEMGIKNWKLRTTANSAIRNTTVLEMFKLLYLFLTYNAARSTIISYDISRATDGLVLRCVYHNDTNNVTWRKIFNGTESAVTLPCNGTHKTVASSQCWKTYVKKKTCGSAIVITVLTVKDDDYGSYLCKFGDRQQHLRVKFNPKLIVNRNDTMATFICNNTLTCDNTTVQWYANSTFLGYARSDGKHFTANVTFSGYVLGYAANGGWLSVPAVSGQYACVFASCDTHGSVTAYLNASTYMVINESSYRPLLSYDTVTQSKWTSADTSLRTDRSNDSQTDVFTIHPTTVQRDHAFDAYLNLYIVFSVILTGFAFTCLIGAVNNWYGKRSRKRLLS